MGMGKDWARFIFLANVAHGHYFRSDSPKQWGLEQYPEAAMEIQMSSADS